MPNFRLSSVATAVCSAFLITNTFAEGGRDGWNGYGDYSRSNSGSPGGDSDNPSVTRGGEADPITGSSQSYSNTTVEVDSWDYGYAGDDASATGGGGGSGGMGGGNIGASLNRGGAGGFGNSTSSSVDASGGSTGDITNARPSLSNLIFIGADTAGGNAGAGGNGAEIGGAGGIGGIGGGLVYGAYASGGAGGRAQTESGNALANGGSGSAINGGVGSVTDITIEYGGLAGNGGDAVFGAGGAGGIGGGIVFGSITLGGGAGSAIGTSTISAIGGNGGDTGDGNITLERVYFTKAAGNAGDGGNVGDAVSPDSGGGAGAGGLGGGLVIGGYSAGGAGGFADTQPTVSGVILDVRGGSGGQVTGNTIGLTTVEILQGGKAGAGGTSFVGGGGGEGGIGGSLVVGGLSIGGAGGLTSDGSKGTSYVSGGNAGDVTGNKLTLTQVTVGVPGAGGDGGSGDGGGHGGYGGATVIGAYSSGGAAGKGGADGDISLADGGNAGAVGQNIVNLASLTISGGGAAGNGGNGRGAGGSGGIGGGLVIGGSSLGGAGGYIDSSTTITASAKGGSAGDVANNQLTLTNVTNAAAGGNGGKGGDGAGGAGGAGGHAGTIFFSGLTSGGSGGYVKVDDAIAIASGGSGGAISGSRATLNNISLTGSGAGADGGSGNSAGGAGGAGGSTLLVGLTTGGAGGYAESANGIATSNGGSGGNISLSILSLNGLQSVGTAGNGGAGGDGTKAAGGAGGNGGGSAFGGLSIGGAGGYAKTGSTTASTSALGGSAGNITDSQVTLSSLSISGGNGGQGGAGVGGWGGGDGGAGGGSVFGGFSAGGAGGYAEGGLSTLASGGAGGNVTGSVLTLTDVKLTAGAGGTASGNGAAGVRGGSVYGGFSSGGAGGSYGGSGTSVNTDGGNAGNVTNNEITIGGNSQVMDIYGGYSRGGKAGENGTGGTGGAVNNNTVTLIGENVKVGGLIYGGYSIDGDGNPITDLAKVFYGNTLNLEGFAGTVEGIGNFENYSWLLPEGVFNRAHVIDVTGGTAVDLNLTKHSIYMMNDGNQLNAGDTVILIDSATAASQAPELLTPKVHQGNMIIYDVSIVTRTVEGDFILRIDAKNGEPAGTPAGELNPRAEAFLEGRAAALTMANRGADMISDYAIDTAVKATDSKNRNMFFLSDGGSMRSETGSHIKVRDFKIAVGVAEKMDAWKANGLTLGAFVEYGKGKFDSYNAFVGHDDVFGHGNLSYFGFGALMHMDLSQDQRVKLGKSEKPNGAYINAAIRAGNIKHSFDSADMIDAAGVRGKYDSKTKYYSAMANLGYMWNIAPDHRFNIDARYTLTDLAANSVNVGKDVLRFGSTQSSRIKIGGRYTYAKMSNYEPYVGLAYEREMKGNVAGRTYIFDIDQPSLKGNTGIVELGVKMKPDANNKNLKINFGIESSFGKREGTSANVRLHYAF